MDSKNLSSWINVVASAAVLVGLILVIIELRQSKALVRAQLSSDAVAIVAQLQTTIMGEDSAAVLAKACLEPDRLTPAETTIVNAYMTHEWYRIDRIRSINEIADLGIPWEEIARGSMSELLTTQAGVGFAENMIATPQFPELSTIMRELIDAGNFNDCGKPTKQLLQMARATKCEVQTGLVEY